MVIRIEDIGERPVADMGGLRRGMGGVARGGDDDPGGAAEKAEDLGDGIAEAVEEDDILGGDLHLAPAVGLGAMNSRVASTPLVGE